MMYGVQQNESLPTLFSGPCIFQQQVRPHENKHPSNEVSASSGLMAELMPSQVAAMISKLRKTLYAGSQRLVSVYELYTAFSQSIIPDIFQFFPKPWRLDHHALLRASDQVILKSFLWNTMGLSANSTSSQPSRSDKSVSSFRNCKMTSSRAMYFTVFVWKTRQMAHIFEASMVTSGTCTIINKHH